MFFAQMSTSRQTDYFQIMHHIKKRKTAELASLPSIGGIKNKLFEKFFYVNHSFFAP